MGKKEFNGKISFEEIDPEFIALMAKRMSANKGKYPVGNWQEPMDVMLLVDALERHLTDLKLLLNNRAPILNEDEEAFDHLAAIAINCQFINWQITDHE